MIQEDFHLAWIAQWFSLAFLLISNQKDILNRGWLWIKSKIEKFILLYTNVRECLSCYLVNLVLSEVVIHAPVEPYVFHLFMWEAFSWLVLLFPLARISRGNNIPRDGFNVVLGCPYVIASNWLSHILTQDWKMKQYSTYRILTEFRHGYQNLAHGGGR